MSSAQALASELFAEDATALLQRINLGGDQPPATPQEVLASLPQTRHQQAHEQAAAAASPVQRHPLPPVSRTPRQHPEPARFPRAIPAIVHQSTAQHPIPDYLAGSRRYVQERQLGVGAFGVVVKARDLARRGEPVAIKLLRRGSQILQSVAHAESEHLLQLRNYKEYVQREIENQVQLQHPLIVEVREVFLTPTHLAIAMEYARGGDLFTYITRNSPSGRLQEDHAKSLFQQLILGLDFCHRMGITSRDLKLENLLLDRNGHDGTRPLLKICDFGFSKNEVLSSANTTNIGTPTYMAPELIDSQKRYDGKKVDIWSCAVILYAVLFGQYPFDEHLDDFYQRVFQCQYKIPETPEVSAECVDMIKRMLVADPEKRITMHEIKKHPFFLSGLPDGALDMNDTLFQQRPFSDAPFWENYKRRIRGLVEEAVRGSVER